MQNSAATDLRNTSFGLQILRLNRLTWSESPPKSNQQTSHLKSEPVPAEINCLEADTTYLGGPTSTDSGNQPGEASNPKDLEGIGLDIKNTEFDEKRTGKPITSEKASKEENSVESNVDLPKVVPNNGAIDEAITPETVSVTATEPQLEDEQDEESVGVSRSIDIQEDGEERERAGLDTEVTELDSVAGRNAEEHGEQSESC